MLDTRESLEKELEEVQQRIRETKKQVGDASIEQKVRVEES